MLVTDLRNKGSVRALSSSRNPVNRIRAIVHHREAYIPESDFLFFNTKQVQTRIFKKAEIVLPDCKIPCSAKSLLE